MSGIQTAIKHLAQKRVELSAQLERIDRIITALGELSGLGETIVNKAVGKKTKTPRKSTKTQEGGVRR